ncbi:hypothetical protein BN7_2236 [Wickerhamomyces ciferrii]|uniref:ABC1 atypical kinase-like domain-containing protein n=1 Tax=Wickerhamomyces ciferrii (strain ATCC 14091 / BCRC 22168 / CBS 111 / JCM 3599 / NBRC 0793 / NRRL Y-1031 F-60-10) TaxID=1206466 RepID=K0KKL0_WICCF|nr:uncharacterized protein BN7_2236 [Wickerhamomyces ciferrii]CCH42692.1 hypothetical protein BN7_2236 [Wickerhamomyces ciferrii]
MSIFITRSSPRIIRSSIRSPILNSTKRSLTQKIPKNSSSSDSWAFRHNVKKYITLGILGAGTLGFFTNDTFHDGVKHTYLTAGRVSVVTWATLQCFYHYNKVLNTSSDDKIKYYDELSKCHLKCAKITLKALERNGGIYIKLGQHISAMTYLLPKEWTDTMIPLQDKCPESTFEEINELFEKDLNKSIDEIFSDFDKTPIGVASLAQVHIGTLKATGEKVAVKCQHPSLKQFVPLDIYLTQSVFKALDKVFPDYPLVWLGEELQSSIYVELNFNKEAENAIKSSEYFENFQSETALRIPKIISSTNRILIMEFIGGSRLDDIKFMEKNNISRSEVSSCLSHIFNNMIFTPGVGVHCDPHGGNLAIRPKPQNDSNPDNTHNFEIILYDHGLYRDVSTQMRRDYAHFWLALLDKDHEKMKKYAAKFAGINEEQFPLFAAAITGRDINTALNYDITKIRSPQEIDNMKSALSGGEMLTELMKILSKIPRVVLLILKTNDLTRHLDETLQNPLGPERTFLILSQYCAKTTYNEERELAKRNGFFKKWISYFKAWFKYQERWSQLFAYDCIMLFKNWIK